MTARNVLALFSADGIGLWRAPTYAGAADRAKVLNIYAWAESAIPFLEPAIRNNSLIYPPPVIRSRLELQSVYTPEETRPFTRAWLLFKSGL